jgi:hypothetical protein
MGKKTGLIDNFVETPRAKDEENFAEQSAASSPKNLGEPKEKIKKLCICLPASLHKQLKSYCVNNDVSMADVVRDFLQSKVGKPSG